jgi:hypothetical protein
MSRATAFCVAAQRLTAKQLAHASEYLARQRILQEVKGLKGSNFDRSHQVSFYLVVGCGKVVLISMSGQTDR